MISRLQLISIILVVVSTLLYPTSSFSLILQPSSLPAFSRFHSKSTSSSSSSSSSSSLFSTTTKPFTPSPTASTSSTTKSESETSPTTIPTASFSPTSKSPKIGLLFMQLGGPLVQADVQGFLYELFADPSIIRLPICAALLQKPLAKLISTTRSTKAMEAYESIGGGSPILKYTNDQATLITNDLKARYGLENVKSYVGMRYWYPFTEEALNDIYADGVEGLVLIPLYPHFSYTTTGSSLQVCAEEIYWKEKDLDEKEKERTLTDLGNPINYEFKGGANALGIRGGEKVGLRTRKKMTHTVIEKWYERPGYINAMAGLINKELESFTPEELAMGGGRHVLFSAHGVPQQYVRKGDPYKFQIEESIRLIGEALPSDVTVHLAFQSRVGPIEWLRPYTDDVIPDLGAKGVKNLVVAPVSFVSEHIETLEEIDMEYKELALESGISNWRRAPALNTDPTFITDMADCIYEALQSPIKSLDEVCAANNCPPDYSPSKRESVLVRCGRRTAILGAIIGIGAEVTYLGGVGKLTSGFFAGAVRLFDFVSKI